VSCKFGALGNRIHFFPHLAGNPDTSLTTIETEACEYLNVSSLTLYKTIKLN